MATRCMCLFGCGGPLLRQLVNLSRCNESALELHLAYFHLFDSRDVFSQGVMPDIVAYNVALSVVARCGRDDVALAMLERMRRDGEIVVNVHPTWIL